MSYQNAPATPSLLLRRWASQDLTGDAQHALVIRIRQGYMNHLYQTARRLDGTTIVPSLIWKGHNHSPWQGQWVPTGDWITLSNIRSCNWSRNTQQQGSGTASIVMDNIAFLETEGIAGMYHTINRGYFSPERGIQVLSRPKLWTSEGWDNVLNGGYQIDVWEGYGVGSDVVPGGPAIKRTWVGLIETCDMESHPDVITLTARDFGVLFTDQRVMGWNKARECIAPVTFADRRWAQGETKEYGTPKASSGSYATSTQQGVTWQSATVDTNEALEYVEIHLPAGHYEDIFLACKYSSQVMYMALKVTSPASRDDSVTLDPGWVDLGNGNVPGTDVPWIRQVTVDSWARRWYLGHGFDFGDNSVLRLYFTDLSKQQDGYGVKVNAFYAFRFGTDPSKPPGALVDASTYHWILVDDVADIVRMLCLWAGFKEFYVESFGWSLVQPMRFQENSFFMDVVNEIITQGNFIFYMGQPSDDDMSLGIPHFEHATATDAPQPGMIEMRDSDMIQALEPIWDSSNLPYVIRYRGEVDPTGYTLDEDLVKRYMATYYPPWAAQHYFALGNAVAGNRYNSYAPNIDRVAGVRRHFTATLGQLITVGLQSNAECLFACILAAIQYALEEATGQVQFAGLPSFDLNTQVSVVEAATASNTRLWVTGIQSQHSMGPNGKWLMTLQGAMIDTEDMYMIAADYRYAYTIFVQHKPPSGEDTPAPQPYPAVTDVQAILDTQQYP